MANRVLSIELGLNKIKLCVLTYNTKSNLIHLEWSYEENTPVGTVTSQGIYEIDTLAVRLQDILDKNNIKVKNCIFITNSTTIYSKVVELPEQRNSSEYLELIRAKVEMENLFPISLKQNILTYTLVDSLDYEVEVQPKKPKNNKRKQDENVKTKKKKLKKYTGIVYLAPESLVSSYLELAKILKLKIKYIDYIGNSVYNLVGQNYSEGSYVLIHIADFNCIISIVENGCLQLQRIVDFNCSSLGERILVKDALFKCKTLDEAFDFINSSSFLDEGYQLPSYDDGFTELDLDDIERLRDELIADIDKLFTSIESFIGFYRKTGKDIENVVVVNQSYEITSLQDSLSITLNRPVTNFNINNLRNSGGSEDLMPYVGCIGSVINPTNFNIESSERERINTIVGKVAAGTLIVSVWVSCILVGFTVIRHEQLSSANEKLKSQISEAEKAREIYNSWQTSVNNLSIATEYDSSSSTVLNNLDIILEKISRIMPTNKCKISGFNGDTTSITFSATTDTKDTMALFLQGLNEIEEFVGVEISGVTDTEGDDYASGRVISGSFTCLFESEESDDYVGINSANGAGNDMGEGSGYGQVTNVDEEFDYNN